MPSPALQGAPGLSLGHSPRQCCTLPGAGDSISALWTPQNRWSPQKQESKAALEQGCGYPQAQWPVSHSLNVPDTGDRVWVLCQIPAIPCPPAARSRLSCVRWPCCVPGHSASPAICVPWPCSVLPQMTPLARPAAKAEPAPLAQPLWDLSWLPLSLSSQGRCCLGQHRHAIARGENAVIQVCPCRGAGPTLSTWHVHPCIHKFQKPSQGRSGSPTSISKGHKAEDECSEPA